MEQKIKVKKSHGGARQGAGRPNNSTDKITVKGLLTKLKAKTNVDYEELLINDFLAVRNGVDKNDKTLTMKYHQLILAKVMDSLNRVEVVDNGDQLKQKEQAFVQALQQMIVSTKEE